VRRKAADAAFAAARESVVAMVIVKGEPMAGRSKEYFFWAFAGLPGAKRLASKAIKPEMILIGTCVSSGGIKLIFYLI
jgi:Ni,Fe-hydrogenase I small subunit